MRGWIVTAIILLIGIAVVARVQWRRAASRRPDLLVPGKHSKNCDV